MHLILEHADLWALTDLISHIMPVEHFFAGLPAQDLTELLPQCPEGTVVRNPQDGTLRVGLTIQAFLLRTADSLMLIDAGLGAGKTLPGRGDWHQRVTRSIPDQLARIGVRPDEITHFLCTHLHVDHVGWATELIDGVWQPTFPKARVYATQAELDHARQRAENAPGTTPAFVWEQTLEPLVAAGLFHPVRPGDRIHPLIHLHSTPGHSPGHLAIGIGGSADVPEVLIVGDAVISPLQVLRPDLAASMDHDPTAAAKTRRRLFNWAAQAQLTVLPTHFPQPSLGRISKTSDGFIWNSQKLSTHNT